MAYPEKYHVPALRAAFRAWHEREGDKLAVKIYPRYDIHGVEVSILGAPDALVVTIVPWSIAASVHHWGALIDILFETFANPKARGNEWANESASGSGEVGDGPGFETKAAFWEHYLFEPFARWLAEEYAPAKYLDAWVGNSRYWMSQAQLLPAQPKRQDDGSWQAWWRLEHEFYTKLMEDADRAERLDVVRLSGLSTDEVRWLMAAAQADEESIGSYEVGDLSQEGFFAAIGVPNPDAPEITPDQLEIGKRLLAERRAPRDQR